MHQSIGFGLSFGLQQKIADLASAAFPQEICGLVVADSQKNLDIIPAKNLAENPEIDFTLDPQAWVEAEKSDRSVVCLYHSHTNDEKSFTLADVRAIKSLGIPWWLISLPSGATQYYNPNYAYPFLEREWIYGLHDCYSLVRDVYQKELGIALKDYDRLEALEWADPTWNRFNELFLQVGFREVTPTTPLIKYDVLMMQVRSDYPNHLGIMMEPNSNVFYHHLYGRLSEASVFDDYWQKVTVKVLQYPQRR